MGRRVASGVVAFAAPLALAFGAFGLGVTALTPTAAYAQAAPAPARTPSPQALQLSNVLVKPIIDAMLPNVLPKLSAQAVDRYLQEMGPGTWAPRPGYTETDVRLLMQDSLKDEFVGLTDEMVMVVAEEFDRMVPADVLGPTLTFFASPNGRSIWTKIVNALFDTVDPVTGMPAPPPNFDVVSLMSPQEMEALGVYGQTRAGQQFGTVIALAFQAAGPALERRLTDKAGAIDQRMNERFCAVATGPMCPVL